MAIKNETLTSSSSRQIAVLTKEWSYHNIDARTDAAVIVPIGTEYTIGKYSNAEILPNGDLRWFYWSIPQDHFEVYTEETTTTTTITTTRK